MAIKWNITKENLAKRKLVAPAWYRTRVVKYEEKLAKDKESTNVVLTVRIVEGEFAGAEKQLYFNEKYPDMMGPFLVAVEPNCVGDDGGISANLSETALLNKEFMGHWERGEYNGKPTNEVNEYMPVQ